jgi:imidazolonepropionase-like amidohydrolase
MRAIRAAVAFDGEVFLAGGATVLVEADRIVAVLPREGDLPADVPVREVAGTLLPGLFDAHVHLVADGSLGGLERAASMDDRAVDEVIEASLALQVAAGVTTVRDLGDVSYRTLDHRDAAREGVPRIVAAGPPVTVPDGHCHFLGGALVGPGGIRTAVVERVEHGVDVVKVMASGGFLTPGSDQLGAQFTVDELRELAEVAHDAGLPVLAHAHSLVAIERAVEAGVDGLEHFTALTADGVRTPDDLLDRVVDGDITIDPTVGWDPALMPSLDAMPPALRALVERLGVTPEEMLRVRADQLARIRAHGVRVVSGLDAGVQPAKQHGLVWRSVTLLLDAGFPVPEALATATSAAADDCGLGEVTGRLRPDLAADLLVVDGDLRDDPGALGRPVSVLVRGVEALAGRQS